MHSAVKLALGLTLSAHVATGESLPQSHALPRRQSSSPSLWVSEVPSSPQPYAVRHYGIPGVSIGSQIYRFPVTGASSDNAFTIISTAAPASGSLGVLPHSHHTHYENFFCLKGRFQLWAADAATYGNEEARLLTPGDYGAVPQNTAHTFQVLDPDTDMVGIIQPGGFEALFYALADGNFTPSSFAPYQLTDADAYNATGSSPPEGAISALESFDVYAQLGYAPSGALVNGSYSSTGAPTGWHEGQHLDELGADEATPYFVAKDYGPKYLSAEAGFYQIVQPLVTGAQSAGNFTAATIVVSQAPGNGSTMGVVGNATSAPAGAGAGASGSGSRPLAGHCAFEVVEGLFTFEMGGETLQMATGDVVFVPAGTAFQYYSQVPFTKVLYVSQGADGLDSRLIANGESGWEYITWPAAAA